jgi:glycosyltransferase involved in cell wall biosynthesis
MGGGATRAYNVARGLTLNGCKVTVVAAAPHYPMGDIPRKYRWKILVIEYKENMKIIRTLMIPLPSKGLVNRIILFIFFIITSLFALPALRRVDVIWAANPNILSFYPALIYSFIKKAPIALNVDDPWPEELCNLRLLKRGSILFKIGEILAKIVYYRAKALTPISPAYIKMIAKRYSVSPSKIHVVRAGVDTEKFKPTKQHKENEKFTVLYSGTFSVAYDFDQILEAASILQEKGEQVQFIIQGKGELADHIKMRVRQLHLKNVKIIDRIVSRDNMAKFLSMADALLLPLRDFGKPYLGVSCKLYEYQAVGKPIICCAEGQPAEYLKETGSGLVVKPGDHKALAKAVLYLRQNRYVAKKLGASGRQYVENNLSIEKIGLKMMNVFNNALSNSFQIYKSRVTRYMRF